ncbi:hypothetical protein GCM10023080_032580 [Streptomyces pseudoechinosporeus]
MTTGGCRVVSPSAIQRNCASSVIDARPCVSIKVTAENLPVSLRLRQRLKNKLSSTSPRHDPRRAKADKGTDIKPRAPRERTTTASKRLTKVAARNMVSALVGP